MWKGALGGVLGGLLGGVLLEAAASASAIRWWAGAGLVL
jgi:hypothetical protein